MYQSKAADRQKKLTGNIAVSHHKTHSQTPFYH